MSSGLLSLSFASAFAGASLYCNLVEQPARLALDENAMIDEWKPSDRRGFALQGGLALAAAAFALLAFRSSSDIRWLVGALIVLASWPYTYFIVVPLNNRLLALFEPRAGDKARDLVRDWGRLEWGQTVLALSAAAVFVWALD